MPFVTFPLFVAVEKYPPAPIIGAAGTPGLDPDHTNTAVATGDPGVAGLVILVTHGVAAGACAAGFAGFDADATAAGFDACAAGFAGRDACAAVGLVTCPPVVAVENPCVAAAPIGATAPPPGLAPVAVATAAGSVGLDPPNGAADAAPGLGPVAVATAAAVVAIVAADADAAPTAGPATAATAAAGP